MRDPDYPEQSAVSDYVYRGLPLSDESPRILFVFREIDLLGRHHPVVAEHDTVTAYPGLDAVAQDMFTGAVLLRQHAKSFGVTNDCTRQGMWIMKLGGCRPVQQLPVVAAYHARHQGMMLRPGSCVRELMIVVSLRVGS